MKKYLVGLFVSLISYCQITPISFTLSAQGTHHVTVGRSTYVNIIPTIISGTDQGATPSVSGQPVGITISWPTMTKFCCGTFIYNLNGNVQVMQVSASPSTTPGNYSLIINYKAAGGSATLSFPLFVDPIPSPLISQPLTQQPPLASLTQWQNNMTNFGQQHCSPADNPATIYDGNIWYYDGVRVYYQIGDYTGNTSTWSNCAAMVASPYSSYILSNTTASGSAQIPGYYVYAQGLAMEYQRTQNTSAKTAVLALANSPYAALAVTGNSTNDSYQIPWSTSREVALGIRAWYAAEMVGEPAPGNLQEMVEIAIGHMNQWFIDKNAAYVQPFMVALTSEALIDYYNQSKDPRIPYLVKLAADSLMSLWDTGSQSWLYNNGTLTASGTTSPAVDLNLLILPLYGWVYQQTGDTKYITAGDAAFNAGVAGAYLGSPGAGGKQFSQNYHWSFSYITWRNSTSATSIPSCGPVITVTNNIASWPAGHCP